MSRGYTYPALRKRTLHRQVLMTNEKRTAVQLKRTQNQVTFSRREKIAEKPVRVNRNARMRSPKSMARIIPSQDPLTKKRKRSFMATRFPWKKRLRNRLP
jgi:hypothetical protein